MGVEDSKFRIMNILCWEIISILTFQFVKIKHTCTHHLVKAGKVLLQFLSCLLYITFKEVMGYQILEELFQIVCHQEL